MSILPLRGMRRLLPFVALLFLSAAWIWGSFPEAESLPGREPEAISEPEILGYCPTMMEDAGALATERGYLLVEFGSASEALSALSGGAIGHALIGRRAKQSEIPTGIRETVVRSGKTLVASQYSFIDYRLLPLLTIHAYFPAEEGLFPEGTFVQQHASKNEAMAKIGSGPVLISWEDWEDGLEFFVVMDGEKKARQFRGAFLYTAADLAP